MNSTSKPSVLGPLSLTVALLACAQGAAFGASTVGTLTANPPPVGIVDSPNNVGHANFMTLSAMSNAVGTAFANNTGGVIDWEGANGWVANGQNLNSHTVSYGVSQANSLSITLSNSQTFGPTTLNNSPVTTSGTNYLGFQTGSPNRLDFSAGLTAWGIAQINRNASRDVTFSFILADGSIINYALQNQDPLGNGQGAFNWYGFQTSAANPLVGVSFIASGFTRFDDMAFIVAPVPEPSVAAILGLASLAGMMRLRSRKA